MLRGKITAGLLMLMAFQTSARTIPVVITWTDDPQTTATISWERDSEGRGTVQYGLTTNYTDTAVDPGGTRRHSLTLRGLNAGTKYYFQATSTDGFEQDGSFKTAPGPGDPFNFAVHGDLQGGLTPSWGRDVAEEIIQNEPDFVIHVGDLADPVYSESWPTWEQFFTITTDELQRAVFMPVCGNHDDGPSGNADYWKVFNLPEKPSNGSCYSFDVGNTHFVALNSEENFEREGQTNWLARDLQRAANDPDIAWIIPYFHHPPYSKGHRPGEDDIKARWCPIFVQYEADVVFSGHSHNYQRTVPIRGINYFVAGGGGGTLYSSDFTPGFHEYATTCLFFVSCHVTGLQMQVRGIRTDGLIFDQTVYTNIGRAVRVDPAFPVRGETVKISYNAANGPLFYSSPVWLYLGTDAFGSAIINTAMTWNAGSGRWEHELTVPSACTNRLAFAFHDAAVTNWDNNFAYNWQALLERAACDPKTPAAGSNVTIRYEADMGPLRLLGQVFLRADFGGGASVYAMTNTSGAVWEYTLPVPSEAALMEIFFTAGFSWDNNEGMGWEYEVAGGPGPAEVPPLMVQGTPVISTNPAPQNSAGDNFDFIISGGAVGSPSAWGGFGDFGSLYFNYDASNLYVGGIGTDLGGSNNVLMLFLGMNTLTDNATNLWHKSSLPQALDYLHNVGFAEPMDVAIVYGDEYGDDPHYTNFTYGGYNFGQGIFYIGTNSLSFVVMPGAHLSQFDGTGTAACLSDDDDGDRRTDRWEASLPWGSLGASSIDDLEWLTAAGVIGSSSTNGKDRYLSAAIVADRPLGPRHSAGNFGYGFLALQPKLVYLEGGDADADGLPNLWEHLNFGTSLGPSALSDDDGDLFSNWGEYVAGTEPTNPLSYFAVSTASSHPVSGNSFVLEWPAAVGRTYEVHRSTNDMVSFDLLAENLETGIYTDTVTGIERAAYRIGVDF